MYHVSAQGTDEHMINVHYYYIIITISVNKTKRHLTENAFNVLYSYHSPYCAC